MSLPIFTVWRRIINFAVALALLVVVHPAKGAELLNNGGFEQDFSGWNSLWSREAGTGKAEIDHQVFHSGKASVRITHTGKEDWSFNASGRFNVHGGDILDLSAWVKLAEPHEVTLCVTTYDANGKVGDWSFGARNATDAKDWQQLRSRMVIPDGITVIQPRLIGYGAGVAWVDDVSLQPQGNLALLRDPKLPVELKFSNTAIDVTFHTADATFTVTDKRNRQVWQQKAMSKEFLVTKVQSGGHPSFRLLHFGSGLEIEAAINLDATKPEFSVALSAKGELGAPLKFPHPFVTEAGTYLVVPMNEGISYPVEDTTVRPFKLITYGGHGICMGFWGVTDGQRAQLSIIESPDDAEVRMDRADKKLYLAPEWDAQRKQFGYTRAIRYVFFDQGGHVAMCKRYREYSKQVGLFKTLAQKRAENPNVDLLVGAVNVWCWDKNGPAMAKELQAAGIERILWSNAQSSENLKALNDMGVLTSRYDIYQDLMDPANFPLLRYVHPDWTTAGWPKDIMLNASGDWVRGWGIEGKNGGWFYCGVLCDERAPAYAAERVPAELKTHPYRCRFIDTTTAAPWRECYNPAHPLTRTESKHWKIELLNYMSKNCKLVTGSETGHEAAVPYLHYFEGMLSLGPYRVEDAGRNMTQIIDDVPEQVAKYQVGQKYRLPLWELVYHDCVVAQWYWGDYNNKLPKTWDKRDLFNALYGTPPMFMFDRGSWQKNKERFVQSYKNTCPIARATGYYEMTDHRFLTADRNVQQTTFANGVSVVVNFGDQPQKLTDGRTVNAMGLLVKGLNP